jgi:putative addiction module component (TIGR02574 family)
MLTRSEIDAMTVEEQVELASELWESIKAKNPWDESVPLWQREILEKRMKDALENPDAGRPWEEVLRDIKAKLKK